MLGCFPDARSVPRTTGAHLLTEDEEDLFDPPANVCPGHTWATWTRQQRSGELRPGRLTSQVPAGPSDFVDSSGHGNAEALPSVPGRQLGQETLPLSPSSSQSRGKSDLNSDTWRGHWSPGTCLAAGLARPHLVFCSCCCPGGLYSTRLH